MGMFLVLGMIAALVIPAVVPSVPSAQGPPPVVQSNYGPGDSRNYDVVCYAQYLATYNALDEATPLGRTFLVRLSQTVRSLPAISLTG